MIYTRCKTCDGHGKLFDRIGPVDVSFDRPMDCPSCKNKLGSTGLTSVKCEDCDGPADVFIDVNTFLCFECNTERLSVG